MNQIHYFPNVFKGLASPSIPQGTPRCYIFLCIKPPLNKEPSISEQLNFETHLKLIQLNFETHSLKLKPILKEFKRSIKKKIILSIHGQLAFLRLIFLSMTFNKHLNKKNLFFFFKNFNSLHRFELLTRYKKRLIEIRCISNETRHAIETRKKHYWRPVHDWKLPFSTPND